MTYRSMALVLASGSLLLAACGQSSSGSASPTAASTVAVSPRASADPVAVKAAQKAAHPCNLLNAEQIKQETGRTGLQSQEKYAGQVLPVCVWGSAVDYLYVVTDTPGDPEVGWEANCAAVKRSTSAQNGWVVPDPGNSGDCRGFYGPQEGVVRGGYFYLVRRRVVVYLTFASVQIAQSLPNVRQVLRTLGGEALKSLE